MVFVVNYQWCCRTIVVLSLVKMAGTEHFSS
jgi:hypothetical protein